MDRRDQTDTSGLIPAHGGYRNLKSYQTAEIVYDATVAFYDRFIDKRSRTHDQMAQAVRKLAYASNRSYSTCTYIEASPPEVAANAAICVIHQANYLLDKQLRQLEQRFLAEGGFTERLYHHRTRARRQRPH